MLRGFGHGISQVNAGAVYIKIYPAPSNLWDTRQVLRILQRFGDVTQFKHMQYESRNPLPGAIMAMYRRPESIENLLQASPIRFSLPQNSSRISEDNQDNEFTIMQDGLTRATPESTHNEKPKDGWGGLAGQPLSDAHDSPSSETSGTGSRLDSTRGLKDLRIFQITVDRWNANHNDYIERQPHYNGYRITGSVAQEALTKVVPLHGLSDPNLKSKTSTPPIRTVIKAKKMAQHGKLRELWEQGLPKASTTETPGNQARM